MILTFASLSLDCSIRLQAPLYPYPGSPHSQMWARKEDRGCTRRWVVCLPELWLQSENFLSWNALNPPKLERRKRLLLNRQAELWRCISGFSSLSSTSWDLWRHHLAQNIFRKVLSQLWSQATGLTARPYQHKQGGAPSVFRLAPQAPPAGCIL